MYEENATTMQRFLTELAEGGDFTDIPMHDDVRFTGPIPSSETLTFADGVMVAADLIIDSTPLRPAPDA